MLQKRLTDIHAQLTRQIKEWTIKDVLPNLSLQPDEELFNTVDGCGKQCPFSGVPCQYGGKGHIEHFAEQHCIGGLYGWHFITSKELCLTICTTAVTTDNKFVYYAPGETYTHKDDIPRIKYKHYRTLDERYASWRIQPDTSLGTAIYWKWLFANFNKALAFRYKVIPAEIPEEWKQITFESVKKDIQTRHGIKQN